MRHNKGKKRVGRLFKRDEAKELNRAAYEIFVKTGTKLESGQRPVDVLAKLAELPIIETLSSFNKKWKMLKAVAILAPKLGVNLPRIRSSLKHSFLSFQDENDPIYAAVLAFPLLEDNYEGRPAKIKRNRQPSLINEPDKISAFYRGHQWRKLRYLVLQKWGRKCMLCGQTEGIMHGDHIKPLRKYWSLRLDFENIQILCEVCNHGKGNWDETDWRPTLKPELKLEIRPTRTGLPIKRVRLSVPFEDTTKSSG